MVACYKTVRTAVDFLESPSYAKPLPKDCISRSRRLWTMLFALTCLMSFKISSGVLALRIARLFRLDSGFSLGAVGDQHRYIL